MRMYLVGYGVDLILLQKKPKWVFQHADKLKAGLVIMFAEDEFSKGQVVVKNMASGEQTSQNISDLVSFVRSNLG